MADAGGSSAIRAPRGGKPAHPRTLLFSLVVAVQHTKRVGGLKRVHRRVHSGRACLEPGPGPRAGAEALSDWARSERSLERMPGVGGWLPSRQASGHSAAADTRAAISHHCSHHCSSLDLGRSRWAGGLCRAGLHAAACAPAACSPTAAPPLLSLPAIAALALARYMQQRAAARKHVDRRSAGVHET